MATNRKTAPRPAPPAEDKSTTITGCIFEMGKFEPTIDHCKAVSSIADALRATAEAAAVLSAALKPPAFDNTAAIKIGAAD